MQIGLLNRKKMRTKIELPIVIAEDRALVQPRAPPTTRSATFHRWSSKRSTQHPPRPDSYKPGPESGVKVKENQCRRRF